MIDKVLALLAPHHCCGCNKVGTLLCDNCKYDITSEINNICLVCGRLCKAGGVCNTCHTSYTRAWYVGERKDVLQRLIGLYKFERAKVASSALGDLLYEALPELPENTVIVPIPTVAGHIRQRGYDHTLLISKRVAQLTNRPLSTLLIRKNSDMQRHSSAANRKKQASRAFAVRGEVDVEAIYLLVDDVMTTGATIEYAARKLVESGACNVWVAVVARQTLD
jgi:ComF family protein